MKRTKQLAALMLACLLPFGAMGCGDSSAADQGTKENGNEPTKEENGTDQENDHATGGRTLHIAWESIQANEQRKAYLEDKLVEAFPNDTFEFSYISSNEADNLKVQVAGGSGPDLMHLDSVAQVMEYVEGDRLVDLTPYSEQYGWQDILYDWAYNASLIDGNLFSIPDSFEGMEIYYNMDVFDANGWSIPSNVEELEAICVAAQEKGIIPFSYGTSDSTSLHGWTYSMIISTYAGRQAVKDGLEGNAKWTDAPLKDSIGLFVDWWQKGYFGDCKSQGVPSSDLQPMFADGTAAMMINGTWAASELLETYPELNWEIDAMPEMRDGVGRIVPMALGGCYAINASCKDPDFAAEVLNWLYTENAENMTKAVLEVGLQPFPLKSITAESLTGMEPQMQKCYDIMFDAQKSGDIGYCAWSFFPSAMHVYMKANLDACFLGEMEVDDFMAEIQKLVDESIAEGKSPIVP